MLLMVVDGFVHGDLNRVRLGHVHVNSLFDLNWHVLLNGVGNMFDYWVRYNLLNRDGNLSFYWNSDGLVDWNLHWVRLRYTNENGLRHMYVNRLRDGESNVFVVWHFDGVLFINMSANRDSFSVSKIVTLSLTVLVTSVLQGEGVSTESMTALGLTSESMTALSLATESMTTLSLTTKSMTASDLTTEPMATLSLSTEVMSSVTKRSRIFLALMTRFLSS